MKSSGDDRGRRRRRSSRGGCSELELIRVGEAGHAGGDPGHSPMVPGGRWPRLRRRYGDSSADELGRVGDGQREGDLEGS